MNRLAAFSVLLLLFFGCAGKPAGPSQNAIYLDASRPVSERVDDLLARMTPEEKIGQMLQVDRYEITGIDLISKYMLGSVLNGGGSNPKPNTPEGWADMYDQVQQEAMKTRLQIPVLYGIDAVHGNGRIPGAVVFPHNIGLGAAHNPGLAGQIGRITAIETRAAGVHWTFAPCIAVPRDIRWGRTYEGFSEDPDIVSSLGAATIRGIQGQNLAQSDAILACAKHFVGDGGTSDGHDQGNTELDESELRRIHLRPYIDAIAAGAGSIMASFSSWNGQKMHGNSYLLETVLRDELGFKGVLVSDWAAVTQLPGSYPERLQNAINAGVDLIMLPAMPDTNFATILELVRTGKISKKRIDVAVKRILEIKFRLGLFENRFADRSRLGQIGTAEHRETARQAVRESAVLLKNNDILPLSRDGMRILVAGEKADDIGAQCGGWTLTWQGVRGEVPGGTSVLGALEAMAGSSEIVYAKDGKSTGKFDVIVAVAGEQPYAEGRGDSREPSLSGPEKRMIAELKEMDIPLVLIVLSGRPLLITDQIELCDSVLAAWLPGTEAAGLADIIFGAYAPTAKLSFTWPASKDFFSERNDRTTLYPLGYGLTY
ncbi:MAG: glycoside hydrolase family 3 C-terminal domain-containing protein [Spirochaetales bacterium]|nr:glycoside hydrolase family 3 C-terminal domain-containing protein [Spirochaetales bacterium]